MSEAPGKSKSLKVAAVETIEAPDSFGAGSVSLSLTDDMGQRHRLVFDTDSLADLGVAHSRATELCGPENKTRVFRVSELALSYCQEVADPILRLQIPTGFYLNFQVPARALAQFCGECRGFLEGHELRNVIKN